MADAADVARDVCIEEDVEDDQRNCNVSVKNSSGLWSLLGRARQSPPLPACTRADLTHAEKELQT